MSEYVIGKTVALLTIGFEMVIVYLYISGLTIHKRRVYIPWMKMLMYLLMGSALMGLEFLHIEVVPNVLLTFTGVFVLFRYSDTGALHNHFFKAMWFTVLAVTSQLLVAGIIMFVSGSTFSIAMDDFQLRLFGILSSKLLHMLLIYATVVVVKRRSSGKNYIRQILVLAICQLLSIYIVLMALDQLSLKEDAPILFIFQVISILFMNIVVFWYYDHILQSVELRHQSEATRMQLDSNQKYYDLVRNQQEATAAINHDIRKHLQVVQRLLQQDDNGEAMRYLADLTDTIHKSSIEVRTPNPIVSAILYDCAQWALQSGVIPEFNISIHEDVGLDAPDITVILGNTIENAKRALDNIKDAPNRELSIILKQKEHFLYYEITNTYDPAVDNGSKNAKHYGLANVENCAEKYGGKLDKTAEGGKFTVCIVFEIAGVAALQMA